MTTAPAPAPVDPSLGDGKRLFHAVCSCDETRALCGKSPIPTPYVDEPPAELKCVVCADLIGKPHDVQCHRTS